MSETKHPIQIVSRRTGLSADVIRAWERRYKAVKPSRSANGRRLYSDNDVKKLMLLQRIISGGRRIGDIAKLNIKNLESLIESDESATVVKTSLANRPSTGSVMEHFDGCTEAIGELDANKLISLFEIAYQELGPVFLLEDLFAPLIQHVRDECKLGTFRQAQEKFVVELMQSFLLINSSKSKKLAHSKILIISPISHNDNLSMLRLCLVCEDSDWMPIYIGTSISADEILFSYEQGRCDLLLIVVDSHGDQQFLPNELRKIRSLIKDNEILIFGDSLLSYQDVIKETGSTPINNIGELRLTLDRLKVLTEFKPVILHAQPEQNS
jgi:MerR family transcriptional regulator, light-induced transcriptional regulator